MCFSPQEHAAGILEKRKIFRRWVVLCEGTPRRGFRRQDELQDAAFYRACLPKTWRDRTPKFFNCGGRSQVVETYNELLRQHDAAPGDSYLDPTRLLAILDADLQACATPNGCPHSDTEDARAAILYGKLPIPESHGKTWVNPWVHKECLFFLPPAQTAYSKSHTKPYRGQETLQLSTALTEIAERLHSEHPLHEADHTHNLQLIQARLQQSDLGWTTDDLDAISTRWLAAYKEAPDAERLAHTLLTIAKAKPVWKEVKPDPGAGFTAADGIFRRQLGKAVAEEISTLKPDQHPIAALFAYLRKTAGLEPLF